jgi:hypothetical protein
MAVSTHNDKVSLSSFSFFHQPGADVAAAALDPMKDGVDSMMLEMVDRIDTEDRLFLGWRSPVTTTTTTTTSSALRR